MLTPATVAQAKSSATPRGAAHREWRAAGLAIALLGLVAAGIALALHGRPLWQAYAAADWWLFPVAGGFAFGAVAMMFPRPINKT